MTAKITGGCNGTKFSVFLRLMIFFLVILLVPVIFGLINIRNSQESLYNQIGERLSSVNNLKSTQLNLWLQVNENRVFVLAEDNIVFIESIKSFINSPNSRDEGFVRNSIENFLFYNPSFLDVIIIHPINGQVLLSAGTFDENRVYLNEGFFIKGKEGVFSQAPYYDEYLDKYIMTISTPIHDQDGALVAVLAANFNMKALDEILVDFSVLPDRQETYLVDNTNHIIAGAGYILPTDISQQDVNELLDKPLNTFGLNEARNGVSGYDIYTDYRDTEVIGSYDFVDDLNLVILTEQDTSVAFEPIFDLTKKLFIFLAVSILLIIFIGYYAASVITRPIKKLKATVDKITSGDLGVRSDIRSSDEIGILAKSFNKMADSLFEKILENKNILETMPNPLCILDQDGHLKEMNDAARKLSGYKGREFAGKHFCNFVTVDSPDSDGLCAVDINDLFKDGDVMTTNAYCVHKNKRKYKISLSGAVIRDKSKKIVGYIMIAKDLRELTKYAKERIGEILPVLNLISLGDFSAKIDLPEHEDEFTDLIVAIDLMSDNLKELVEENKRKTEQVFKSEKKLRLSHRGLQRSKRETEQEKAKAESLLSSLGEGVMAINLQGKVMAMNPVAERLFNMDFNEIVGVPFEKCFRLEDENERVISIQNKPISDVTKNKKQIHTTTYFVKKDNRKIPLSTTISPILFDEKLLGIIGTFRDITREMEVDKAKSEFVSLASHQLRTPMTGIKWLIQATMMHGSLNDKQIEFMQDAITSVDRMVGIVNDLLNISRLEAQTVGCNPEETDIAEFTKVLIKEERILAKKKDQEVVFNPAKKIIKAFIDRELYAQIVDSLVSNALRYSDNGKAVIVSLKPKQKTFDIIVEDQGMGISKEDQKKLFTRFFRTKEAIKMVTSGSGLGLYVVKKILNVCNGKIKCDSSPGKGTTFTVTLPIKGPAKQGTKSLISRTS